MIIAIEGPDRVGKTTVFEALRGKVLGLFVRNVPTDKALLPGIECAEEKMWAVVDGMYAPAITYIFDRFPLVSNLAYALKYGRPTARHLELAAQWKLQVMVLYLRASPQFLARKGDDEIDVDPEASVRAYDEAVRHFYHAVVDAERPIEEVVWRCAAQVREWSLC